MFDVQCDERRGGRMARASAVAAMLCLLVIPARALAQEPPEVGFAPRFAVGGGFQLGQVVCLECDEPGTGGAIGGFEFRFNDDWSVIAAGAWTQGYDAYGFVRSPTGLRHDYFAFLDAKLRWQFTEMRHRPYLTFGASVAWDHDTSQQYDYVSDGTSWQFDTSEIITEESLKTAAGFVLGFGWGFKVGDRVEIRPEVNLYGVGYGDSEFNLGYVTAGVTAWFAF